MVIGEDVVARVDNVAGIGDVAVVAIEGGAGDAGVGGGKVVSGGGNGGKVVSGGANGGKVVSGGANGGKVVSGGANGGKVVSGVGTGVCGEAAA